MRSFTISKAETLNTPQAIQAKGANAIVFINNGDSVAFIGGRPIPVYATGMQEYPSICYYGLEGEIMQCTFELTFATGGTNNSVLVVRKTY